MYEAHRSRIDFCRSDGCVGGSTDIPRRHQRHGDRPVRQRRPQRPGNGDRRGHGREHKTSTTTEGVFSFQDLPLGTYKVTVTAKGFATATTDNVPVTAGQCLFAARQAFHRQGGDYG